MSYIVSEDAKKIIKIFESLKLEAYLCPAGIPTIGYGHTGPDVRLGMKITEQEAESIFMRDINKVSSQIAPIIRVPLNPDQFGALVSFAFNLGPTALKMSTLLKRINANNLKGAGDEFLKWNKAHVNGEIVVLNGLTRRRNAERSLFLRGVK